MTTIVQMSDIHLLKDGALAYGQVDTLGALRRAVRHIVDVEGRLGGIDAVVVSGDIAEGGEPGAYGLFAEVAAPITAPIYVMPGNHDDREAMRAAFAAAGYFPATGSLHYAVDIGEVTLVALDDHVPGAGHGLVSPEQLEWLDATLSARPERPALLFLHHPPFAAGVTFMDAIRLRAAEALEQVVRRNANVRLIACGHLHRAVTTTWAGVTTIVAPAICHSVALDLRAKAPPSFANEPPRVLVHQWRAGELVSHMSFVDRVAGEIAFV